MTAAPAVTPLITSAATATPAPTRPLPRPVGKGSAPTRPTHPAHPTRPAPSRPEPSGPRPRTPRPAARTPAGRTVTRAPKSDAEHAQWDRLHFQTPIRRRKQSKRKSTRAAPKATERQTTGQGQLPDPRRHAASIVTAAAEVLSGHRPVDHLARWTTPDMFEALARRAGLAMRLLGTEPGRARPRARCVHAQITLSGNCEAAVLLDDGSRVRAAAALLVLHRGRWVMSTLEIG